MGKYNVSIDEAREEIQRRWHDEALKKKVHEFLQGDVPEAFLQEPRAVLFRQICIPDSETRRFMHIADQLQLKPFVFEYYDDKFTTVNPDKLRWGRIDVCEKMNKNNEPIIHSTHVIDYFASDGKKLRGIQTIWNENVIEFFHDAFFTMHQEKPEMKDMSDWLACNGERAKEYYKAFYAIMTVFGVSCEVLEYDDDPDAAKGFLEEVSYPAIEYVKEKIGVYPLIVPLFTQEEMETDQWYFDAKMQEILDEKMKKE